MTSIVDITRANIVGLRGPAIGMSQRRWFKLGDPSTGVLPVDDFLDLHLDHFDGARSTASWVRLRGAEDPRDAPFYYQAIRRNAAELVSVGFESLGPWTSDVTATPILVFSIGRCGSTLFSKLTEAAGLPTWSEPDTFSNIAAAGKIGLPQDKTAELTRVALNVLSDHARRRDLADHFVVKMRSDVTRICSSIIDQAPHSTSFFIVRQPLPWARSFYSHFGHSAEKSAKRLAQLVGSARAAKKSGMAIEIIDYDEMVANPEPVFRRLCKLAGKRFSSRKLAKVMAQDSQSGTLIEKGAGRPVPEGFDDAFKSSLNAHAPRLAGFAPSQWLDLEHQSSTLLGASAAA